MTAYLIAMRAAIVLWISLAVMPAEIVFDVIRIRIGAARRQAIMDLCLRPFVA